MSFTKVNPSGWPVGGKLTSAQANQLDTDHANSLDKSTAGDAIAGVVTFTGAGQLQANVGNAIKATISSGILISVAGGLVVNCGGAGGIQLLGGTSEEIQYGSARTVTQYQPAAPMGGALTSGWAAIGSYTGGMTGPAAAGPQYFAPLLVHNGATLTNVRVEVGIATHSVLPATMPELQVMRSDGAILGTLFASAGSASAWNSTTHIDIPCTANNVIDRTQYSYCVAIVDEFGSGSVAGNSYYAFVGTLGSITSMAFA